MIPGTLLEKNTNDSCLECNFLRGKKYCLQAIIIYQLLFRSKEFFLFRFDKNIRQNNDLGF